MTDLVSEAISSSNNDLCKARSKRSSKPACGTCHKRKVKCDGGQPACNACMRMGVECSYDGKVDHRRPPTWSYVEALERRVAEMEEKLLQAQTAPLDTRQAYSPFVSNHLIRNYHGDIRAFRPCSLFHHLPSAPRIDIEDPQNLSIDPSLGFRKFLPPDIPLTYAQHDKVLSAFDRYRNSPLGLVDINLFSRDLHTVLFSADMHSSRMDHYSPMLHNLILAIGWPLVDDSEEVDATVEKFVDCALRWYHVEMDRATLCTITSMALLAVYHADQGSPSLGWIYLSAGGAIVSAMGLQSSNTVIKGGNLELDEVIQRSDAFWAFYIEDAFWALYVGRDCLIPHNQPDFPPLYPHSTDNEALWRKEEVALATIARKIVQGCVLVAVPDSDTSMGPEASRLILELEQWTVKLDPQWQLPVQLRHVRDVLPRVLLLHANACLLTMLLHRPMMAVSGEEALARAESAALRVLMLAERWDNLHSLEKSPIHLQHSIFTAGTTLLLRAVNIPAAHVSVIRANEEKVNQVEQYLVKMATRSAGAQEAARLFMGMRQQWLIPEPSANFDVLKY